MSSRFPSSLLGGAPQGDGTHSRHSPEATVTPRPQRKRRTPCGLQTYCRRVESVWRGRNVFGPKTHRPDSPNGLSGQYFKAVVEDPDSRKIRPPFLFGHMRRGRRRSRRGVI
ncbi:hypothetical protein KUCAC02_011323, partial [Chaenocephalus aceratus]